MCEIAGRSSCTFDLMGAGPQASQSNERVHSQPALRSLQQRRLTWRGALLILVPLYLYNPSICFEQVSGVRTCRSLACIAGPHFNLVYYDSRRSPQCAQREQSATATSGIRGHRLRVDGRRAVGEASACRCRAPAAALDRDVRWCTSRSVIGGLAAFGMSRRRATFVVGRGLQTTAFTPSGSGRPRPESIGEEFGVCM